MNTEKAKGKDQKEASEDLESWRRYREGKQVAALTWAGSHTTMDRVNKRVTSHSEF